MILKISKQSELDWFVWRPILAKVVTLGELKTSYTTEDLLDLHEALDIKDAIENDKSQHPQKK